MPALCRGEGPPASKPVFRRAGNLGVCALTRRPGGDYDRIHTPELHFEQYVLHWGYNITAWMTNFNLSPPFLSQLRPRLPCGQSHGPSCSWGRRERLVKTVFPECGSSLPPKGNADASGGRGVPAM